MTLQKNWRRFVKNLMVQLQYDTDWGYQENLDDTGSE